MKFFSKINMGKASLIMTILGGLASLLGGIASTLDARQTAVETARETTLEYLNTSTQEEANAPEEA